MIKVALCGAAGRMGRAIIKEISRSDDIELVIATEASGNPEIGNDVGRLVGVKDFGISIIDTLELDKYLKEKKPDVLVDFTVADAAVKNAKAAAKHGVQIVIGTTGLTKEQMNEIEKAVKKFGVTAVISPNMSIGVNVLFDLVQRASKLLGQDYSVEIVEIHHEKKIDHPSGTALRIAEILAKERKGSEIIVGRPTNERRKGIYIHSLRLGDVVGDHMVIFAGHGERLEITHRAHGRETFAAGVLKAIRYVYAHKGMGKILDMQDVLGLR